jgi:hypothetical protein
MAARNPSPPGRHVTQASGLPFRRASRLLPGQGSPEALSTRQPGQLRHAGRAAFRLFGPFFPARRGKHPVPKAEYLARRGKHPVPKAEHPARWGEYPAQRADDPAQKGGNPARSGVNHPIWVVYYRIWVVGADFLPAWHGI